MSGDWRELFADFSDPVPAPAAHGTDAHFGPIEQVNRSTSRDPARCWSGTRRPVSSASTCQNATRSATTAAASQRPACRRSAAGLPDQAAHGHGN